jgi:myo-inositol-1(or 4)-monophosphatase
MLTDTQLLDLLTIAEKAAHEAGVILKNRPDHYTVVNSLSASDIKLAADVASEKLIREALNKTQLPIIGEEEGGDINYLSQNVPYWVIDPLDGTYNYARGLPFCCVSIGLMQGLEPVLGVIYDFNTQTTYSALAKGPLMINQKPHRANWLKDQSTSLILSSLRYEDTAHDMVPNNFNDLHGCFKKIRFFGTAALSLAWVASGYAESYIERSVHLWDVAAGLALLKATGGHFKINLTHKKPFQLDCFAASQHEWLP